MTHRVKWRIIGPPNTYAPYSCDVGAGSQPEEERQRVGGAPATCVADITRGN